MDEDASLQPLLPSTSSLDGRPDSGAAARDGRPAVPHLYPTLPSTPLFALSASDSNSNIASNTSDSDAPSGVGVGPAGAAATTATSSASSATSSTHKPLEKPNLTLAYRNIASRRALRPDGLPYPLSTPRESLYDLGIGVPLFFDFVVFCVLLCAVVTLVYSLPLAVLNMNGEWGELSSDWSYRTCSENYTDIPGNTPSSLNDTYFEPTFNWYLGHRRTFPGAAYFVAEVATAIGMLVAIWMWKRRVRVKAAKLGKELLTARHYTVMITGLPQNCTERESLARHFSQWGKVVHVSISLDSMRIMSLMDKRKQMSLRLGSARAREAGVTSAVSGILPSALRSLLDRFSKSSSQLQTALDHIDAQIEQVKQTTVFKCTGYAFVTFSDASSALRCVLEYSQRSMMQRMKDYMVSSWLFQSSPPSTAPARVDSEAPYHPYSQPSLSLSSPSSRLSSISADAAGSAFPSTPQYAAPAKPAPWTSDQPAHSESSDGCCCCGTRPSKFVLEGRYAIRVEVPPEPSDIQWENLHIGLMQRIMRNTLTLLTCLTVVVMGCFSICALIFFELTDDHTTHISLGTWGSKIVNALVITVVNWSITNIVIALGRWERHHTYSGFQDTALAKLLLASYANSGYSLFVAYVILGLIGTSNGRRRFGSQFWYSNDGQVTQAVSAIVSNAMMTCIIQLVLPVTRVRRFLAARTSYTQAELEERLTPSVLHLASRYVNIIVTVSVSFLYATQAPLTPLIALVAVSIQYWIDKRNLLWVNRRPPKTDHRLVMRCFQYLPWCVVFHVSLSGISLVLGPWCDNGQDFVLPNMSVSWSETYIAGLVSVLLLLLLIRQCARVLMCRGCQQGSYGNQVAGIAGGRYRPTNPAVYMRLSEVSGMEGPAARQPLLAGASGAPGAPGAPGGGAAPVYGSAPARPDMQAAWSGLEVSAALWDVIIEASQRPPFEAVVDSLSDVYQPPVTVDDVALRETRTSMQTYHDLLVGHTRGWTDSLRTFGTKVASSKTLTRLSSTFSSRPGVQV